MHLDHIMHTSCSRLNVFRLYFFCPRKDLFANCAHVMTGFVHLVLKPFYGRKHKTSSFIVLSLQCQTRTHYIIAVMWISL